MRVLVIEDDEEMADVVAVGLRRTNMAVDVALDGTDGLDRALVTDYDVIVLDRDLPGTHGDDVCAELLAARRRSRVLMLTAAASTEDLVDGLGLGADDYLGKPFDFPAQRRALAGRPQRLGRCQCLVALSLRLARVESRAHAQRFGRDGLPHARTARRLTARFTARWPTSRARGSPR